jgi:Metallopeptidase family M24
MLMFAAISAKLSQISSASIHTTSEEDKAGFLKAQRLAYETALAVEKQLKPGMTEKEAAKLLAAYLAERGVNTFLHRPFAWFGEHSKFQGYDFYTDFRPSNRKLEENNVYILDVSPIVDGYIGDIGYTGSLTPRYELIKIKEYLLEIRERLPREFASDKPASQIWKELDEDIKRRGYENAHSKYPFAVLGHRVYKVPFPKMWSPLIPLSFLSWFSFQAQFAFLTHGIMPELLTPHHQGKKIGAWAIEPHLGSPGNFGAKFEEILIVEEGRAYWLDNEVPHVLQAAARGKSA